MSEEVRDPGNPRDALKLKLPEPDVSAEEPWADDVLDREQLAARLTNLIRNQSAPLTFSIHGNWGTGKTFLLKRWQKDLEAQGFKAIYFNAWEDDFCDDPLLAILGQMSEYFKEDGLKALARRAAEVAVPLIRENALGVLKATTGVTPKVNQDQGEKVFLEAYLEQRCTKEKLKKRLAEMSAKVVAETKHPMVFIIDELDRCRPTFAIELLERVKHIFDVPNLVFVFGLNRDELSKSLQSVYGKIDSDVYLRRFFDMEFTLPEVDSESFAGHLIEKFELANFFTTLSKIAIFNTYEMRYQHLPNNVPPFWGHLGLSLRDIDYCVRMIALVGKNLEPSHYRYSPWLLALLMPLKLMNPALYRQYIQGNCLGSDVMNYIDEKVPHQKLGSGASNTLDSIEGFLYGADQHDDGYVNPALVQLKLIANTEDSTYPELTQPEYLSKRTQQSDKKRIRSLIAIIEAPTPTGVQANAVGYLAELIDLHQELVRR